MPPKIDPSAAASVIKMMRRRHETLSVAAFTSAEAVRRVDAERRFLREWLAKYEQAAGIAEFSEAA